MEPVALAEAPAAVAGERVAVPGVLGDGERLAVDAQERGVFARSGQPPAHGLVAATFATFGAYLLALPWLGFRMATFLFLLAMPVILEPPRSRRRWIVVLVLAAVATAATYVVFERYLYVLLPRGRWTGF